MPVFFPARAIVRPLLLASLVSSLALSCSSEPKEGAGVVLMMRTDMKVPEGVRSVGVYITRI